MDSARITEIVADPVTLDLVERQPIMQIAYAAADGSPRAVPVGYLLRDGKFVFFGRTPRPGQAGLTAGGFKPLPAVDRRDLVGRDVS